MHEEIIEGVRLSPQQKHLWSLQQTDRNESYRACCAILLEGQLRREVLTSALQNIVDRTEVLRTVFQRLPGMRTPLQVVTQSDVSPPDEYDLKGMDAVQQEKVIDKLFHEARHIPIDFEQGPLVYFSLIILAGDRHLLIVSLPSLCADTAGLKILLREISSGYEASLRGEQLPQVSIQYADLSEWQNELFEADDTKAGREYWLKQDASAWSSLALRSKRQIQQQTEFDPGAGVFKIDTQLFSQLKALAARYETSLLTVLTTSWQVLLWRLTLQPELFIGVCFDGRNYEELEDTVGLFAKFLPVAGRLDESHTFAESLRQVDESTRELHRWQDCFAWEYLAGATDNDLAADFIPACFEWTEQAEASQAGGISFSIYQQYVCHDRFELKLSCFERSAELIAELHYDRGLFDVEEVERLGEQFLTILADAVSRPDVAIRDLTIVSDRERQRLLEEFNQTEASYPTANCVHHLFEAHAERDADAMALICEDQEFTYGELNRRANQLAHHLRRFGVGPEVLVGLCVERSSEMIVGMLGILKAGGAYVPLDPAYPPARLKLILDDARPPVVLTQERLTAALSEYERRCLRLDADWNDIAVERDDNPPSITTSRNLVYAIYTSGSTGTPKGVAIEHGQLLNYTRSILDKLALPFPATFATASTFAADLGNTAIFPALCSGGCLNVILPERFSDPDALADYISRHPIDCLKIVPSHLAALLTGSEPGKVLPRERLILGGEASSWGLIEKLRTLAPECRILNHYGPTETTVGVLTYPVEEVDLNSATVPIGRPIGNTQLYLLDSNLQPVPVWATGEVYIGGLNVARGYHNSPELTAEKFVANPFTTEPGTRLYRTGDLARYLPNGVVEFLGRRDHQVKVRGFRIELGEIEAALSSHPLVHQSTILVSEDEAGEGRLFAYFVPAQESRPAADELRGWMDQRLPRYMVPSAFVMLEQMPLTPNGKVDRQALLSLDTGHEERLFVAPRTVVEEVIAGIWMEILRVRQVSVHDSFFEIGGHSLLATQMISRLRSVFQIELPVRRVFEHPTLVELAAAVETSMKVAEGVLAPPIVPIARDRDLPLSFAQQRLWFLDQLEPGSSFYNIPAAVRLRGTLDVAALEQGFREVIRRHESLRTRFGVVNGVAVQVIDETPEFSLPVVDVSTVAEGEREAEARRVAREESQKPFDLSTGPLLRARVVRLSEQDHVLLCTMHHIISDGWSVGVLIREITTLYEAHTNGEASPLPALEIQYADYAHWQREWLQGEVLEQQLGYWKQQMDGAPAVLELPTDYPRPAVQTFRGANQSLRLPADLTSELKALTQREGATLFMTLLAAFQTLLSRYSGQEDIVVSTGIANRNRAETEQLIGFFVNTLVLRTDLSGNPSFTELLARVREVTLGAYAHQDVPFELLVEALAPVRDPRYTPLFQVMLVLQNARLGEVTKLTGLEVSGAGGESGTAKFDLTMFVEEQGEELRVVLEYNTDLFAPTTIEQMLVSFQRLVTGIVAEPERSIGSHELIDAEERRRLIGGGPKSLEGDAESGESVSVAEMFAAMAARTPTATAIEFGERQLTYGELDERANTLANYLITQGARRNSIVALLTADTCERIVGMLGTMKAGAAFMPLDVRQPAARLRKLMELAPPEFLLTDTNMVATLGQEFGSLKMMCVDSPEYREYHNPIAPEVSVDPDQLSYIYFTSGSSGTPKAIAGRLKGIAHFIKWEIEELGVDAGVRASQLLSASFDGSLRDIFLPLCAGGTVCVPERHDQILEGRGLVQWLEDAQIEVLHCVPSVFRALVNEELRADELQSLRHIVMAGEALLGRDVGRWKQVYGERIRLLNLYGTSETTMAKFSYRVIAGDEEREVMPIGKPIAGAEAYLLDERGEPCGRGMVGEIYIRTPYRSLGYYRQPELTAAVFVPNPFSNDPTDLVHKTGDMGRELEDGNFEYLGRRDEQVKVRGARVELKEVENAVRGQAGVMDVAVIEREDTSGYTYLCAYMVLAEGVQTVTVAEGLAQELPDYMVPSAYVEMDELPRTISGKVDRRALPAVGAEGSGAEYVAPRTQVEEALAQSWERLLGRERIGIDDNFFRLGGHSLLATQVMSRVRESFSVEIGLRVLFEHPTVRGLGEVIEERLRDAAELEAPAITRVSRDADLVLSFAQQRMWFLDQFEPNTSLYNIPSAARLRGPVDLKALEQSFSEVIRRHEALRTRFGIVNGMPVQLIDEAPEFTLPVLDLSTVAEAERETEARNAATEEIQRPFDLSTGPLLRACVLRLSEQEHVLLCTMHHIISDGWSMGVLIRELTTLYDAYAKGEASPLPELAIQYADYAQWQRQWLQGGVLEQQLAYWKQQLAGAPPLLELPTDFPRPAVQTFRGATHSMSLSPALTAQLNELSKREDVTLFITMLAAFQTLLYRYTAQTDIVVGAPVANRTRGEIEPLIGYFVNTLVLRTDLSADPVFVELMKRVRDVALGAYAHQDVPFEMLVEALQPERDVSRSPLFQVMLVLQNAPKQTLALNDDLQLSAVEVEHRTAKFDLMLLLTEGTQGLTGVWEYNTDLFEAATIERMNGHFEMLLAGIVATPEHRLSKLPLLTDAEREQMLLQREVIAAADAEGAGPRPCLHQLFEAQVERTPDAVALVYQDQQLSYAELNRRSNQLAHYLRGQGIGPEALVGVCQQRSVEMVVSLLAILKAGGAYVPLDPTYPQERLAFMLEDAGARLLLTQERLETTVPTTATTFCVDRDWELVTGQPETSPVTEVMDDNLAYLIYTSGSTGRPKAVAIAHRSAQTMVYWALELFLPEWLEATLASASICFDLSVFELFVPLCGGGRVILAENALQLPELANANDVKLINMVPSAMAELVRSGGVPTSVRVVNLAGEALGRKLVDEVYELGHVESVFNLYGPSEDTTYSTWEQVDREESGAVLIGRTVSNTQGYVVDGYGEVAPVGVSGELLLGGAGLARGYLHRGELTAERFIPDGLSGRAGARLYRTGDLCRYRADGRLEYLGRIDQQVKVRGYRIELGEVETALMAHPGVSDAVVLATAVGAPEGRLVAYVVQEQGGESGVSVGELRSHLEQRLPLYMIPSVFMMLDRLPLSPNGKVDRKKLAAIDVEDRSLADSYVAPRTPTEEILAGIWGRLLKIKQVGIHDDFFALGGHSLLATQVMSQVRESFGVEVGLRVLFERPTVSGLGDAIEEQLQGGVGLAAPSIGKVSRAGDLALSFAQQRLWFLDQFEPKSALYNIPAAVRLQGELNVEALKQSLGEIIRRHEALRTTFAEVNDEPVQVINEAGAYRLMIDDFSKLDEDERESRWRAFASAEVRRGFDLQRGPLVRAKLLRLSEHEHVLLCTMHHIISDGWSMGVLIRELATLYEAYAKGDTSPLPELAIQYADYAQWQREWLQGEVLEEHLGYWKQQLAGAPPLLELPTDFTRPAIQTFRGATQAVSLSPALTGQLHQLSKREDVTLFITLLAAFQTLLYRYTAQTDIVVGAPIANRTRAEIEPLIGFFVNTLVLRADLSADPVFVELMRRVRDVALGAYAHQQVPFEMLVEALQPERDASRSPLFQVMLVLQNAPKDTVALNDELQLSGIEVEQRTAKFDLTLLLTEGADGLAGVWEYNTDLFEERTIERMNRHFEVLLAGIVATPECRLSELPLLTDAEQEQLLLQRQLTASTQGAEVHCLHQLFEAQVERTPDAIALVYEEQQLSYAELNQRANQVAHYLQSVGVARGSFVGICLRPSVEMVVAVLGVLKAGAAYVPLDPAYPQERLSLMLSVSNASVVITEEDSQWSLIASHPSDNPRSDVVADNAAYLIFTSGSSGTPKAAAISHRTFTNLLNWYIEEFAITAADRVLLMSSISFDLTQKNLFAPLVTGARLSLAPAVFDARERALQIQSQQITFVNCTPSAFYPVVEASEDIAENPLGSLRQVIFGGERIALSRLQRWLTAEDTKAELVNSYGPTECTDVVSYHRVSPDEVAAASEVSLGRGIPNTHLWVADKWQRLAPPGVVGELWIGGTPVGLGYVTDAALTSDKFRPDPWNGQPGARVYRTGDKVRYLGNGELLYLGRVDEQVKVRGYRIELGEVETALMAHPHVREAAVVIRGDGEAQQLVAFAVAQDQANGEVSGVNVGELRTHLERRLPQYMVPSVFMMLDQMPLTPSGKVDRRALAAIDVEDRGLAESYVAPGTPTEEILAGIWTRLLKIKQVGIHDDFFALGGHSLLAAQLVSRIRKVFQVEVPLRQLFDKPTIAGLVTEINRLKMEGSDLQSPSIERISGSETLWQSYAQQRLWFLDRLEPNSSLYNIPVAVRLRGTLDLAALEQSFRDVIRRHESLRTRLDIVNGAPVQVVDEALEFNLPVLDLSTVAEGEREAEARRLATDDTQRPFDLSTGPLLRASVLRLSEQEHVLLCTMHHIISDGWSMEVFTRDLTTLYDAHARGAEPALPELPIQYADYAHWQREWLQGEVLEKQLGYWKQQLAGAPAALELPTDYPRPAVQSFRGAREPLTLSPEVTTELKSLAQREGVTLFMTLVAAFQSLLSRYSGQDEIVIGTPIAGRNQAETENLIGFFINTLVLRTDLSGNPTFQELLRQVRDVALGAYAHQEVPFEKLVEELQPQRDVSRSPLFQVMLVLQSAIPAEVVKLQGLEVTREEGENLTAKFDLTLSLTEGPEGLAGTWEYNTDLFEPATIERMNGHFQMLLAGIIATPECRVSELPLLTDAEQEQLLFQREAAHEEQTGFGPCLHQLFESQAERTPEAVALVHEDQQLTYAELNERANQLAHYLQSLDVAPGSFVAVCLPPSIELVVAVLGTLKAGAAYVPLDPAYPQERLALMLSVSNASVVLTAETVISGRSNVSTAAVVCLDSQWSLIADQAAENPHSDVVADNAAYLIFTSGSSGTPKAAAISHRTFTNLLNWYIEEFAITAADRVLLMSSISFDLTQKNLFAALTTGARLSLASAVYDARERALQIQSQQITFVNCTPSAFYPVVEASEDIAENPLGSLRQVIFGGERIALSRLQRWLTAEGTKAELVNSYGPTECTDVVSYHRVSPDEVAAASEVSLGRGIPNTQLWVADKWQRLVPTGVVGELWIGGVPVGLGYVPDAALTSDKFRPDPWSGQAGARVYRTGDKVRYLSNGELLYLGRVDEQVKVRGYRIELGEVETALMAHPSVREAVVTATPAGATAAAESRLVAYVVAQEEKTEVNIGELRTHLEQRLPLYMIPSIFMTLDQMPLTPSGKVNRRALPVPEQKRPELGQLYVAPRSELESAIVKVWQEVLGIEKVGVYDNFFDLGGHSLLMVQVHLKLREVSERAVTMIDLFQYPTIDSLAKYMSRTDTDPSSLVKVHERAARQKAAIKRQRQTGKQRARING